MDKKNGGTADIIGGTATSIVTTSQTPLLLLSADLLILAASRSFCQRFGTGAAVGRRLPDLGQGEWDVPQLTGLLLATVTGPVAVEEYKMDLKLPHGAPLHLLVSAHRLEETPDHEPMIMFSVQNVTENRKREIKHDKVVRENAIMLTELQHRVANSLQIVASVLLHSARRLQNDEVRTHLTDAHNRLMSVAALQQQLAISAEETVEMRVYCANLCRTIGASMINDREKIRIDVEVDDTCLASAIALSLGLIITELLINALKHAFPDDRAGLIRLKMRTTATGWELSVTDDGIGMTHDGVDPKAGLGSSLVRALTHQVAAEISVTDADPGTRVTITHVDTAEAGQDPEMVAV